MGGNSLLASEVVCRLLCRGIYNIQYTIYVLLDKRKYSRMTWPLAYIGTSFLLQAIGAIPTNSSSINLWRQWSMRRLVNLLEIMMGLSAQPLRNLCQQPAGHNGCRSGSRDAKKRWVPGKRRFMSETVNRMTSTPHILLNLWNEKFKPSEPVQ